MIGSNINQFVVYHSQDRWRDSHVIVAIEPEISMYWCFIRIIFDIWARTGPSSLRDPGF